jgi:hypothetical protein
MYLLATRPDLAFSVYLVSRYIEMSTKMHVAAIKRILRYVKGTLSFGIMYKSKLNGELHLEGWSNTNYVCDVDDRKSTSDYVFKLRTCAISWSSKKKPIITLSTIKAKFFVAASCACQGIWLRDILSHLKLDKGNKRAMMFVIIAPPSNYLRILLCLIDANT